MSSKPLPIPLCCRPAGDRAVAVELGDRATPELNARVHALATQVRQAKLAGVVATVPSYRSLLVYYEPALLTYDDLTQWLSTLSPDHVVSQAVRRWQLPALYGGICSQDLQALAGLAGLDGDEVVRLHAAQVYRVYMVGFSPGFSYLGEMPAALQVPRKSAPVSLSRAHQLLSEERAWLAQLDRLMVPADIEQLPSEFLLSRNLISGAHRD